MRDFYTDFYAATEHSRAHAAFCERVFGANLCQHGFADMAQIDALLDATHLGVGDQALDLGCGNGMIAEYISDRTGAHVTGLDYIPGAIRQATERTAAKAERLAFVVGDINHLEGMPSGAFDAIISIDTLYFSEDYVATIRELVRMLRAGGQMAILFSHGREPWVPVEQFDAEALAADKTPLAVALIANGLKFHTWDFTQEDCRLARLRQEVLTELKPDFEAEGNTFIWENRMGDARGISQAAQEGLQARYLYRVRLNDAPG
jgi:ubiquinone/menaquinone biosynthesis C-methylase UbiE